VTDRCNYRCTYCMPEDGATPAPRDDVLSFEEIVALARAFVTLGVRRLRLTGGEPTVRRDLPTLARMLRALPGVEELALSTNGERLAALAAPLRAAGVDRLNVSLDTLDAAKFRRVTGRGDLARVLAGLDAARAAGFASIKLNTVAVRGFNDDELAPLCAFAWARGFVPRFIEQMPMAAGQSFIPGQLLTAAEIRASIAAAHAGSRLDDDDGGARGAGPARYHRVVGGDAASAPRRFGIISPMTEHFCDRCNRARLSSTGALHACLAHDDAVDLRGPLRAGGERAVVAAITAAIAQKRDGHAFQLVGLGG
jgi:cyclic pyranopterin phosphate synthase